MHRRKAMWGHSKKTAICKLRRGASGKTNLPWSWTSSSRTVRKEMSVVLTPQSGIFFLRQPGELMHLSRRQSLLTASYIKTEMIYQNPNLIITTPSTHLKFSSTLTLKSSQILQHRLQGEKKKKKANLTVMCRTLCDPAPASCSSIHTLGAELHQVLAIHTTRICQQSFLSYLNMDLGRVQTVFYSLLYSQQASIIIYQMNEWRNNSIPAENHVDMSNLYPNSGFNMAWKCYRSHSRRSSITYILNYTIRLLLRN